MKFIHPDVDYPIEITPENPHVLVIEHPTVLSKTVFGLIKQVETGNGEYTAFREDKELKFKTDVVFFDSCHRINFADRTVWNRIIKIVQEGILSEDHYEQYNQFRTFLSSWIDDVIFDTDLPIEFRIEDFDLLNFIKVLALKSTSEYSESLLEQLVDIAKLYESTITPALYIFQNLKTYLTIDELELFYKHLAREKVNVLLIESNVTKRLLPEKYTIIDIDKCVI